MSQHPSEDPLSTDRLGETYPDYEGQLEATERIPPRAAETVPADTVLPPALADELDADLYTHQAEAIEALQRGEDVSVATSTASGKTWVYTLYFALRKRRDPDARALFLYPTKALSRDQERAVNDLLDDVGVDATAEVYDGDTPTDRRPLIRDRADVVISNLAGINAYLPNHTDWYELFRNCEVLVVDESHTYTGLHGMHAAWVLRRLRRVLAHYGADPQVVCSTATIGNPAAHSRQVTGAEVTVVDDDGSPRGARDIGFWNPPVADTEDDDPLLDDDEDPETAPGVRASAAEEAASVAAHLGVHDIQTLLFTRSRQGTEVGAKQARRAADEHPTDRYLDVEPYHAGLSKQKRRGVENQLKSGKLDAVLSTNALELGIDIGSVDATVLAGYPGTRQSFWQQIGRAGRGTDDALSVFVARGAAMDQYIMDHREYLLEDDVEDAVVDLANNVVYASHVRCASDELPLTRADAEWFGPEERLERAVSMWSDAGQMTGDLDRGAQYAGDPRPQSDVSMYATDDVQFQVRRVDGDVDMEPIDRARAYRDFHPGAIKLHDGVQYEVVDLVEDTPRPYIELREASTRTYTQTLNDKAVRDVVEERSRDLGDGIRICAGMGTVSIAYHSYKEIDIFSGESRGIPKPTGLDPIDLRTQLMWIEFPPGTVDGVVEAIPDTELLEPPEDTSMGVREWTVGGGLHGAEHGMIKLAPLELRLDNSDIGGLSTVAHPETPGPVWFIHDGVDGGVGFSHSIYDSVTAVAARTRQRVAECDCGRTSGCPACLMSDQCGNDNSPLHRPATTELLARVLERL